MEQIFKVGDKVFCYNYGGWGEVIQEHSPVHTMFVIKCSFPIGYGTFTWDGRDIEEAPPILSFTKYTLEGFSQERPKELPKKGDIVWVREAYKSYWQIGHFYAKDDNMYLLSSGRPDAWSFGGVELRTTNPYENKES
jgi:hypothetical protein